VDFQVFRHVAVNSTGQGIEPKSGGRPKDAIKLSVDCFKTGNSCIVKVNLSVNNAIVSVRFVDASRLMILLIV